MFRERRSRGSRIARHPLRPIHPRQGSQAFEAELAAHTGTAQCVLGSSWTMIVYCLHQLQGIGPGDEIIVPSHTAFPSMEPLIHLGAKPVFADIDDTFVMDLAHVESLITPRTVGIIGVHLYGHPIDNDRLLAIGRKHNLWVIEDCAQAQGAKYKGKTVGSMGDFGAFSFFPSKNLTVLGDGGCIMHEQGGLRRPAADVAQPWPPGQIRSRIYRLQRALQRDQRRHRPRDVEAPRRVQCASPQNCRALRCAAQGHRADSPRAGMGHARVSHVRGARRTAR